MMIPPDKSMIQMTLYLQVIILDKGANNMGMAFTNGLEVRIGGQP